MSVCLWVFLSVCLCVSIWVRVLLTSAAILGLAAIPQVYAIQCGKDLKVCVCVCVRACAGAGA